MCSGKSFTWIFPLFATGALLILLPAGRWKLPPNVVRHSIEMSYPSARLAAVVPAFAPSARLVDQKLGLDGGSPNAPSFSMNTEGTAILFAHIGDGEIPGTDHSFKTSLFLINDTDHVSEGIVEFYDDQGAPLMITVGEQTESSFPFELQPFTQKRIVTAGVGATKTGWVHVHASQPLIGAGTFGITDSQGKIQTEVGIPEGLPGRDFTLFADMIGSTRTGVALTNSSATSATIISIELSDGEGNVLGTSQWQLPPLGHRARFIDEIFAEVPGVQELEGSVHITSENEFSGITLRSTGNQLTSMPMIPAPGEGAEWTKLAFPHIGDGNAGGLAIRTSVLLINNSPETTTGQVEFFASDGNEMDLAAGGTEGSAFEFMIPAGGVYRLRTDAAGTLKTGWARVTMDQPIEGTALYTIENDQGVLQTEVGVASAALQQEFILIADSLGQANTGIALVNPIPESERRTISIDLDLYAHDYRGRKAGVSIQLDSMTHKAIFFNELFEWVPDIDEFEGVIRVSSWDYMAPVSLRQAGTKLTALPVMPRQRGFSPTSELVPSQNLPGEAPSYRWTLRQAAGDFGIRHVTLQAAGLQLHTDSLSPLQKIAYGYIPGGGYDLGGGQSQAVDLVLVNTDPVEVDIVEIGEFDKISVLGSGKIFQDEEKGLTFDFDLYTSPYSYSLSATVTHFYFSPGTLKSPETAGQHTVNTVFTSVSTRPNLDRFSSIAKDHNIVTQITTAGPLIHQVEPVFPMPGSVLTIKGEGFDDGPVEVEFPTFGGNRAKVATQFTGVNTVQVLAPENLADGHILLWQGAVASNPYEFVTLFSPQFKTESGVTPLEDSNQIELVIEQEPGQFAVYWFEIDLFGLDCDFANLSPGTLIGNGLWRPEQQWEGDRYELKVESVDGEKARIRLFKPSYEYPESFAFMTLESLTETVGLRLTLDRQYPDVRPQMLREFLHQSWTLSGTPFTLPPQGEVTGLARLRSTPIETGDLKSPLQIEKAAVWSPTNPEE